MNRSILALLPLAFVGCSLTPDLPDGEGQGLVSVDRAAPADTNIAERPEWSEGDRFRYRQGGVNHMTWRVTRADETGYDLMQEETSVVTMLDRDLGVIGEDSPEDPSATRRRAPVDSTWTWPLWVGKRWATDYLRKVPGAAIPVRANYVCDGRETVKVPAGTFDCLRVWRTARPLVEEGRFLEMSTLLWWSPDVGYFVKRLQDGTLLELEDYHRQQ